MTQESFREAPSAIVDPLHDDGIEQGLAAWGVPLFVPTSEAPAGKPDPAGLLGACLRSHNALYKNSAIPLLLRVPEGESRRAVRLLAHELEGRPARWLRWVTFAAEFLGQAYRSEITRLAGSPPLPPTDLFPRASLPPAEIRFGECGLRALSDEIAAIEGDCINWKGTLEGAVSQWLDFLWFERSVALARADHARTS